MHNSLDDLLLTHAVEEGSQRPRTHVKNCSIRVVDLSHSNIKMPQMRSTETSKANVDCQLFISKADSQPLKV